MEYNVKDHGDALEKAYADFIQSEFTTYEQVWRLYIGNKGNDRKADIKFYPDERNEKRQRFSEHSYTILQSVISLRRLIQKRAYSKINFDDVAQILNLQDSVILFFTYLGRIRDNVNSASTCLQNCHSEETTKILEDFFFQRHIVVHGKMLPFAIKKSGDVLIPSLSTDSIDNSKWYDKRNKWEDISFLKKENLEELTDSMFSELLHKLVHIFGVFKTKIESELKISNLTLYFENDYSPQAYASGSTSADSVVKVYGDIKIN